MGHEETAKPPASNEQPTAESMPGYGRYFGPNYYGEQDENGVDLSLIRENLKLTPLERIRKGEAARRQALQRMEVGREHREAKASDHEGHE